MSDEKKEVGFEKINKKLENQSFIDNCDKPLLTKENKIKFPKTFNKFIINNEDLFIEKIEEILKKNANERNIKEHIIVAKFLESTHLSHKFKKERMREHNLKKLLHYSSMFMQFLSLKPYEFLFREGDYGDKFYIILKGEINILRTASKIVNFTPIEYIRFLQNLNKAGHKELIIKNIRENIQIYYFEYRDINLIDDIIFALKIMSMDDNFYIPRLIKVFNEFNRNCIDYGLDFTISNSTMLNEDISSILNEKIINKLRLLRVNLKEYSYLEKMTEARPLNIYDYEIFFVLHKGKFFGDTALDNQSNIRNSSIQCGHEPTILGWITNRVYTDYLLYEKQKLRKKEIGYLLEFIFFTPINYPNFSKNYFDEFTIHESVCGHSLLKENDKLSYVYFILEGEFDLSFYRDTPGLISTIEKFEILHYQNFNDNKYENIIHIKKKIVKDKSRNHRVIIYGKKQVLGIYEYLFRQNVFFDCKVLSEKALYFRIEINVFSPLNKYLDEIFNKEPNCRSKLQNYVKKNFDHIIERLKSIQMINYNSSNRDDSIFNNPKDLHFRSTSNNKLSFPNIISQTHIEPKFYKDRMTLNIQNDSIQSYKEIAKISSLNTDRNTIISNETNNLKITNNDSNNIRKKFKNQILSKEKLRINEKNESIDSQRDINKNKNIKLNLETMKIQKLRKNMFDFINTTRQENTILLDKENTRFTIINLNDEDNCESYTERKNKNGNVDKIVSLKNKLKKLSDFRVKRKEKPQSINVISEKEISADLEFIKIRNGLSFKHLFKIKQAKSIK